MTPLQYAILTFLVVFGSVGFFAALYLAVERANRREFLPSPDEALDRVLAGPPDPWPPSKEEAECCKAHALPDGRPVIGYCGPDCERRPS